MAITPQPKCSVSGLDLTSLPPVQDEIESVQLVESACFTGLPSEDHLTPLEFRFGGSSDYIDVDSIMLYLQVEILNKTAPSVAATPPPPEAPTDPPENKKKAKPKRLKRDTTDANPYGPTNLFLYSLFERVELKIGGKSVSLEQSNYPYIMYALLHLYFPAHVRKTLLQTVIYADDVPYEFDYTIMTKQLLDRLSSLVGHGGEMYGRVFTDFLNTGRFIPGNVPISLIFHRTKPSFNIIGSKDGSFGVKIKQAKLYTPYVTLQPQSLAKYQRLLSTTGFKYPVVRYAITTKALGKGDTNVSWSFISNGKVPRKIVLMQVRASAYNGQLNKNPYNFEDFGLQTVQVFVNKRSYPLTIPLSLDKTVDVWRAYHNFFKGTDFVNLDPGFNGEDYFSGYFMIPITLTRDGSTNCGYSSTPEVGNVDIELCYKQPLTEPIMLLALTENDSVLTIKDNGEFHWNQ